MFEKSNACLSNFFSEHFIYNSQIQIAFITFQFKPLSILDGAVQSRPVMGVYNACKILTLSPLQHLWYLKDENLTFKHRKNCECCHHHSLFKDHNVIVNIVVLNCQKYNQCLKCQVAGHKSLGLLFEGVL